MFLPSPLKSMGVRKRAECCLLGSFCNSQRPQWIRPCKLSHFPIEIMEHEVGPRGGTFAGIYSIYCGYTINAKGQTNAPQITAHATCDAFALLAL